MPFSFSAFFAVQKALPILKDHASVILVASSLASRGDRNMSVHNASKTAVRSLARTFATELMPRGIRVNTLSPGPIDTPIIDTNSPTPEAAAEFRRHAAAALFPALDDSSFSTGMELRADGGHAELTPEA